MPGVIDTSQTFANGDQVTSGKLINITGGSTFDPSAITGDGLIVTDAGKLSLGAVHTSNLDSGAVTSDKLAAGAVTAASVADGSIGTAELAPSAVTADKLAANAVVFTSIDAAAIATKAEMQGQTAGNLVTPDMLKYHPALPKAYGVVNFANGDAGITGGYNVASASDTGANTRNIVLSITMADTNYVVIPGWITSANGGSLGALSVLSRTTTSFVISGGAEGANNWLPNGVPEFPQDNATR